MVRGAGSGRRAAGVPEGPSSGPGPAAFVTICAVAGCVPDLDFLWGRHTMETHSLGAAVLAGAAVLGVAGWRHRGLALAVALSWASHVLFDWLGSDTTAPLGVMALWPWSSHYYFADAFIFEAISRRYWLDSFWRHNLGALVSEAVILGPPAVLLWWFRFRRGGRGHARGRP